MKLSKTQMISFTSIRSYYYAKVDVYFEGMKSMSMYLEQKENKFKGQTREIEEIRVDIRELFYEKDFIPFEIGTSLDVSFGYNLRVYFENIQNEINELKIKGMNVDYLNSLLDEYCQEVIKVFIKE